MRTGAAVLALASVITLGACGGGDGGSAPSAPSTPVPPASLGGNVNYVDVSFVNNFGFETPGNLNYGADQITRRAGRNHLDARTNTLKNAVSFTDDRGNQMMLGTSATVVSVELVRF